MMKTYQIEITKYAQTQMRDIVRYVKLKLKNPDAAKLLLLDLKKSILSLENMPQRIPLTDEPVWYEQEIHRMPVKNYLVYFWIDESRNIVYVTAVIYSKREQKDSYLRWKCNSNPRLAVRQENPIVIIRIRK